MTRTWIVRLEGDDGTDLDGRLEVTAEDLRFAPGTRGELAPAVVIRLADIASSSVVRRGITSQIRLVLSDGRRLSFDHGLRPIDELAEILHVGLPVRDRPWSSPAVGAEHRRTTNEGNQEHETTPPHPRRPDGGRRRPHRLR